VQEAFRLLTLAFAFAIAHKLYSNNVFKFFPYVVTAFAVFLFTRSQQQAKIHENRLRRWDFSHWIRLTYGQRSKCADLCEQ